MERESVVRVQRHRLRHLPHTIESVFGPIRRRYASAAVELVVVGSVLMRYVYLFFLRVVCGVCVCVCVCVCCSAVYRAPFVDGLHQLR